MQGCLQSVPNTEDAAHFGMRHGQAIWCYTQSLQQGLYAIEDASRRCCSDLDAVRVAHKLVGLLAPAKLPQLLHLLLQLELDRYQRSFCIMITATTLLNYGVCAGVLLQGLLQVLRLCKQGVAVHAYGW